MEKRRLWRPSCCRAGESSTTCSTPRSDAAALKSLVKPDDADDFHRDDLEPPASGRRSGLDGDRSRGKPVFRWSSTTRFRPLICRPIEHGASLVVHSVTKMIGGHSDLTLGALIGAKSLIEQVRVVASTLGQTGNPFESWLAQRGLATLSLRFHRACATSLELAGRLESHDGVDASLLSRPADPTPTSTLASRVLEGGFGAIVTIDLGTRDRAQTFIRSLAEIPFAPSLGDVQTTLSHPTSTSHRGQSDEQLARQGISPGMIRISVGIEDPDDLWREFRQALCALDAVRATGP